MSLSAQGLHRRFRGRTVVHDLSLRVDAGEIVGLLGPNGAGKTTTFRMLTGRLTPHAGAVHLDGVEATRWPLWRRARAGLGYLPQEATIFRRLTVAQNVAAGMARSTPRAARAERVKDLLGRFELSELAEARGQTLSGGERRRVEIVRALAANPRVLLVDEPFAGLDPRNAQTLARHLRTLADGGVGVLLTDHDARQTLEACDRIYIVSAGVLVVEGAPRKIRRDPRARALYLGDAFDEASS